jgi:hypothetical protein
MNFAISVSEGKLELMKQTIQNGVSASVGLESSSTKVVEVKAGRLGAGRQLQDCATSLVSIEIESAGTSADSPGVAQLADDLRKACTEGSLVTIVKAAATDLGILTQCIKSQKNELPEPAVEKVLVQRVGVMQLRPTDAPTTIPTRTEKAYSPGSSPRDALTPLTTPAPTQVTTTALTPVTAPAPTPVTNPTSAPVITPSPTSPTTKTTPAPTPVNMATPAPTQVTTTALTHR